LLPGRAGAGARDVVLRVGDGAGLRTEAAGIALARRADVPAPQVLAQDGGRDPALLLVEAVSGSSAIPSALPATRLRTLGATAAALHATPVPDDPALPHRDRPIALVDFAALRRAAPADPLLRRAEALVAARRPAGRVGLVHGDLWQGNTLWRDDDLVAVIDWDCAGSGQAGVDIGSLRCDAALCFGVQAAAHVLEGWQRATGRAADDVPYWDAVAALCSPPDMGWFVAAIAGQGRPDLTAEVLLERRDAFLEGALDALEDGRRPC
jgi:aminoglycoside phosphotransferase (APT) family kinase protein